MLEAQESADSSQPVNTAGASQPAYYRLNFNQLGILLKMHAEGAKQTTIASALGCTQANVSLALKRLGTDTTDLARHQFKSKAYKVSRRLTAIAEKGKDGDAVKAGKVVLEAAGVISSANSSIQLGIQVVIGGEAQAAIGAGSVQVEALDATVATVPELGSQRNE